jgi:hypothetical protein
VVLPVPVSCRAFCLLTFRGLLLRVTCSIYDLAQGILANQTGKGELRSPFQSAQLIARHSLRRRRPVNAPVTKSSPRYPELDQKTRDTRDDGHDSFRLDHLPRLLGTPWLVCILYRPSQIRVRLQVEKRPFHTSITR